MSDEDDSNEMPPTEHAVGYRRPPVSRRFQPGRSGNPKGRPRGVKNFSTRLDEELARSIVLNENGKRKRMQKIQAIAKQLVHKALSNDAKAINHVIEHARRTEGSPEASVGYSFAQREDEIVLNKLIQRLRLMAPDPGADTQKSDNEKERER